jgi:predicted O-linked N-acetylglucosamine transferase (SPINDLY family)
MDYRITDAHADPSGVTDEWHTERLVRLPGCAWCYSPVEDAPPVEPPPVLRTGVVTFGSFNALPKINDEVLEFWAGLLRQVPGSRLLLKAVALFEPLTRKRILERLESFGLERERVRFYGALPSRRSHLEVYHRVDIALDPFPYHGTTTTCEALWMGVPVVTLAGGHHAARVGVSLLHAAGLEEFIARDRVEYLEIALRLSRDLPRLAALRAALRERLSASPLLDAPGFARRMEAAFREMWRAWCAGR